MMGMFFNATNFDQDLQDWDTGAMVVSGCQYFATYAGCSLDNCNLTGYDDCKVGTIDLDVALGYEDEDVSETDSEEEEESESEEEEDTDSEESS